MKRIQIYIILIGLQCFAGCKPGQSGSPEASFWPWTSALSFGVRSGSQAYSLLQSPHSLDYADTESERIIQIGQKTFNGITDRIFLDGLGREAYFRGFNISGNTKLAQHGFKPFQNTADAEIGFTRLAQTTGTNMIRFLISWEGVHTAVDTIDYSYLDAVIAQMRIAIGKRMYVLIDFHQDLFSRNLFNRNSWYTGNGAPAWIISANSYPTEYCGIICATWSQNNLTNEAIRLAYRNFWNDKTLNTTAGTRTTQEEFVWQLGEAASYLKKNLTAAEFEYVLGIDPFNEPVDGGMEGLTPAQWDNQKLWPFYDKVRQKMNQVGWDTKWVYAEPLVFWNTNAGIVSATGGGHLTTLPGEGFVFNSHFYDAARMSTDLTGIDNATYFTYLDQIRNESRFLQIPVFLSEFGMWIKGIGAKDTPRMISAVYQAMEISDGQQKVKSRYADLYNPLVSGTEWHWDYYRDHHREYMNGNPSKLITSKDAWNSEDYSVVSDYGTTFNMDYHAIQRAYPRKSQGNILSFYYNTVGFDSWNNVFQWGGIRPDPAGPVFFSDRRFAILIWRGRKSDAPTELFLPPHFSLSDIVLISDKRIYNKGIPSTIQSENGEAVLIPDRNRDSGSGNLLILWDDLLDGEDPDSTLHFLIAVDAAGTSYSDAVLSNIQSALKNRVVGSQQSPIYMTGKMTPSGYPSE
ncbi:glycosyl hydrolase family 5 [Leptospira fletcheri]|uniref:Glycosyl hydrolase family 5 n=1 Tax=Leptospira fletcheri TaxID=2484981 RepID=A0A4R9GI64_9LEPT|nr:cellulase family glycosylhydrolase [Leptospira fletcheri]TGK12299.1 glycosyl hydrolase family 5 [Leptospira fletcheri]